MKNNILMSVLLTASLSATLPLSAASHVDVEKSCGSVHSDLPLLVVIRTFQ
jgi:hypothetical protein